MSAFPAFRMSRHGFLGVTYHVFRAAQFMTLIAIIGLTGNFVNEMNNANVTPPTLIVAILSIVSLAALYLIIISILFFDQKMRFEYPLIIDSVILTGLIVLAVLSGRPLSYLKCNDVGSSTSASTFASTLAGLLGDSKFSTFIAATRDICVETKAVWGLVIADCIFFSFTVITGLILFFLVRQQEKLDNDFKV